MVPAHALGTSPAHELSQALRQTGSIRQQQLVRLAERYPGDGPTWAALAEEHIQARRREEALHAARRALAIDPGLHGAMSPELQRLTGAVARGPEVGSADAAHRVRREPRRRAPSHAGGSRPSQRMRAAPGAGDPRAELARVRHLSKHERRGRLNALSMRHPDHAPIWLALAEDHIEDRRVEEALACAGRALALEPALDAQMSPALATAVRYHDRQAASPDHGLGLGSMARHKAEARARVHEPAPAPRPGPVRARPQRASTMDEPTTIARRPPRREDESGDDAGPGGNALARALELTDAEARRRTLADLYERTPDHPAVLFHFAIESALAGRTEDAQRAGRRLQEVSPKRYRQLYELAESYWPSTTAPASREYQVSMTPAQKAELKTVMLTIGAPAPIAGTAVPVAPVRPHPASAEPRRTVLLPVPPAMPIGQPRLPPPSSNQAMQALPIPGLDVKTSRVRSAREPIRALRTVVAVAGGVAAGLLVALLLVVAVG